MLSKEKLERIGELSRKKRSGDLSATELEEQNELRSEYIKAFRLHFEGHLEAMGMQRTAKKARSCGCGCGHKH